MALHPYGLGPFQKPWVARVAAILDRQQAPARWALLPIPNRPLSQRLQRLQKGLAVFDSVHGLGDSLCGFSITTAWSHGPFLSKSALPHATNTIWNRVAAEFDKTPKVNIIEGGVNRLLDSGG